MDRLRSTLVMKEMSNSTLLLNLENQKKIIEDGKEYEFEMELEYDRTREELLTTRKERDVCSTLQIHDNILYECCTY